MDGAADGKGKVRAFAGGAAQGDGRRRVKGHVERAIQATGIRRNARRCRESGRASRMATARVCFRHGEEGGVGVSFRQRLDSRPSSRPGAPLTLGSTEASYLTDNAFRRVDRPARTSDAWKRPLERERQATHLRRAACRPGRGGPTAWPSGRQSHGRRPQTGRSVIDCRECQLYILT